MSVMVGGTGIIGQDMVCGFSNGKYKTFEGTEIVAENCVKARVKDLVVEGKTIQDTEDLSNIESVAEKERNLANYIIKAIGTSGKRVVFDNKNCLKITSTFSRTIVLDDTSNYQIYVNAYANNENNKAYSVGDFGGTYIGCGSKTWQVFKMTNYLNKFSIYNYQNSEVYIDLDTLSLVRVNNPYPLKLNVRGKNLFNLNNLEYGNINTSTGKNLGTTNTMKRTIDYIKVNPKTQYIINSSCGVFEYDSMKKFLSSNAMAGRFTTTENTEYIKVHGNTISEFVDNKKIQLEEGTVATSYEPYREPSVTTLNLPIPLRSLQNNVCDTVEGNRLVQRVEKVVLDENTEFNFPTSLVMANTVLIGLTISSIPKVYDSTISAICNKLQFKNIYSLDESGFFIDKTGTKLWLRLSISIYGSTLEEIKTNLALNPITIYYPLATPIIHNLEILSISTTKGTNIITTSNNIKPKISMKVKVK